MNERKVIKLIPTFKREIVKGEGYSESGDAWLHPEVEEEEAFNKKVQELILRLATKNDFLSVGNFYADSAVKQLNLMKYFNALFWLKPDTILIGEAPGIHGCVRTGIPFTSERLINNGYLERHFKETRFVVEGNKGEASATVIWGAIRQLSKPPIMWNAFPLHPKNDEGGNRTPTAIELQWGADILETVLSLFHDVKIITIGRKAESSCKRLGVRTEGHLNHPSRQANIFRRQFNELFSNS